MKDFKIVALAGGVGGARLSDGLAQVLQPENLIIIVNTGDDFVHLGLRISPDLDTVCYTLAGMENQETGWGRRNETWQVFGQLKKLGMPGWFQLGDTDLATHIIRTLRLQEGAKLSQVTQEFCEAWGIKNSVLPMSDDFIQTRVYTEEGDLGFQEYFVHRQSKPVVKAFKFEGVESSLAAPGVIDAIEGCDVVVICPSNPWVSIDPILCIPKMEQALKMHPIIAVSPLIGSKTVKGPAAKMFREMGIQPSALAVAQHYGDLVNYLVIDHVDEILVRDINRLGIQTLVTDILMHDRADRGRLAQDLVSFITTKG